MKDINMKKKKDKNRKKKMDHKFIKFVAGLF